MNPFYILILQQKFHQFYGDNLIPTLNCEENFLEISMSTLHRLLYRIDLYTKPEVIIVSYLNEMTSSDGDMTT